MVKKKTLKNFCVPLGELDKTFYETFEEKYNLKEEYLVICHVIAHADNTKKKKKKLRTV